MKQIEKTSRFYFFFSKSFDGILPGHHQGKSTSGFPKVIQPSGSVAVRKIRDFTWSEARGPWILDTCRDEDSLVLVGTWSLRFARKCADLVQFVGSNIQFLA